MVFVSDIHVPYHDETAVKSALRLIEGLSPHRVVINGDVNDFFQLSRFNTSGERLDHLQEEIDAGVEFRRLVRAAAPDAVIDETEGNHDSRIRTYVNQNAKALHSLEALAPDRLFGRSELEIRSHPGAGFLLRPFFLVKHGNYVRQDVPASAKAELLHAGISGISGHTHRLGTYRRAGYERKQWTEQGCLCRLEADYVTGVPNWTHGLAVGMFSTRKDSFIIDEVQMLNGKFTYGGQDF